LFSVWQSYGNKEELGKKFGVYIYICVCVCMRVRLDVYILRKKCRKNKSMTGLQETITYVDPLSALPFFEC